METSVVTIKGQIVVPARIRRKFGMKKGVRVAFVERDGHLTVQPLDSGYFDGLAGVLKTRGKLKQSLAEDKKREREL